MTTYLTPTTNDAYTLQDYITDVQRLLHDSTYRFWTQQEFIDYCNIARRKVAAETGCNRILYRSVSIPANANNLAFADIHSNRKIVGILDFFIYYSETYRPPLLYYPFSEFARLATVAYAYNGVPMYWSQIGEAAHISPVPLQAYTADLDVSVEPYDLVELTDIDTEILSPFTQCVKFYMAYLAKLKHQRRPEAEAFLNDYLREQRSCASSTVIRRLVGQ